MRTESSGCPLTFTHVCHGERGYARVCTCFFWKGRWGFRQAEHPLDNRNKMGLPDSVRTSTLAPRPLVILSGGFSPLSH